MIDDTLVSLLVRLDADGARAEDYVLFGSTVLYLHGIDTGRAIGDVDVFVRRRLWGQLFTHPTVDVLTPRAGDPPFLRIRSDPPTHVFYDWTTRDREWMDVDRCFRLAELVTQERSAAYFPCPKRFRCIPLAEVRRHKALAETTGRDPATRSKHQSDLAILDERLGT